MPSLKDLKVRIKSVKSTQKITKAMKMVAASKLRRAREKAEAARPYAERMQAMLQALSSGVSQDNAPLLMGGTGKSDKHLLIVATSDRGLCGAFNSSIIRATRRKVAELRGQGKTVKLFCVGRKGYEALRGEYDKDIVGKMVEGGRKTVGYDLAERIAQQAVSLYETEGFDVCTVVYNRFKSAISQIVTFQQIIPFASEETAAGGDLLPYEYEPEEEAILTDLLPRNLAVQVYRALLENAASEQGARMTAMDNATRNAGEMIKKLTLQYNRSRQASITKELIEIISGAEAI